MPPEVEILRITLWTLAAVGFGLIVCLAHWIDQMSIRQDAVEAELDAMRLERWARGPGPRSPVLYPALRGGVGRRG